MSNRLEDLEPETRKLAIRLLALAPTRSIPLLKLTHTLRTLAEQERLYAKGRTIPGEPCSHIVDGKVTTYAVGNCPDHPLGLTVTRAKAGQSPHNWGMAFDLAFQGAAPYRGDWDAVGKLIEEVGLVWGGKWASGDKTHAERPGWKKVAAALPTPRKY